MRGVAGAAADGVLGGMQFSCEIAQWFNFYFSRGLLLVLAKFSFLGGGGDGALSYNSMKS